jgi:hypothetical protein
MAMSCISGSTFKANLLVALVLAAFLWGCASTEPHRPSSELPLEIATAMERQVEAWNRGDMEGFMSAGYLQDDSLLFIGSRGLTFGYDVVLANYERAYPDGASRGHLAFEQLRWIPLGAEHGFVVGKWSIERQQGESIGGHYSLVWALTPQGWRIIADHSS